MNSKIYILLSFAIGVSSYAVAGEQASCKECRQTKFDAAIKKLHEKCWEKINPDSFESYRKNSGGIIPGEAADPLIQNFDKKDEDGEKARRILRAYSKEIIGNDPDLLKLLARPRRNKKRKINQ